MQAKILIKAKKLIKKAELFLNTAAALLTEMVAD